MYKFIITENFEYYFEDTSDYEDIIKFYNRYYLNICDETGFVRVEISPSETPQDLSTWSVKIDQDIFPKWTFKDDPYLEERIREKSIKIAREENICQVVNSGNFETAIVGDYGTATSKHCGKATAGLYGTAITKEYGDSIAGNFGTAIAGDFGTASAGCRGIAKAGNFGRAVAGNYGKASAGDCGTASAGENGLINIKWYDENRCRLAIGYVGEDGIKPNVDYKVENGKLVEA